MSEKNEKLVELTDEQMDQVSGGNTLLVSHTAILSQNSPTRTSAASNLQKQESSEEQNQTRSLSSVFRNRPRPRE